MRKTQEQVKAELQARLSQYQAAQKSRRRFLLTGGALVLVCAVVLLAVMLPLSKSEPPVSEESSAAPSQDVTSSQDTVSSEYVLPPVRYGQKGTAGGMLAKRYDLETAIEDSDIVARVRVGDWLGEDTWLDSSFFEVFVEEQNKGDPIDSFILMQMGTSEYTFDNYPLYTAGEELLVFVAYVENVDDRGDPLWSFDFDHAYGLVGCWTTALYALTDEKGDMYYVQNFGGLKSQRAELTNYAEDKDFAKALINRAGETDPIFGIDDSIENWREIYDFGKIYSAKEYDPLLTSELPQNPSEEGGLSSGE